jgi:hypothetical protein
LTSAQFLAQRLRQLIKRPQATQGLLGSAALLPLKVGNEVLSLTSDSALFGPSAAPAFACNLLASKQWTAPSRIRWLALVQRAVAAHLAFGVIGVFFGVRFRGVGHVAQRDGLGVFLVNLGLRLRTQAQAGGASRNGHQKNTSCRGHGGL